VLHEAGQTFPPALERLERVAGTKADAVQTMPAANNGVEYQYSQRARMDVQPLDSWTLDRPIPGQA